MYHISSFLLIPKGSRVLPLSMRYASLAFRALSLLDLMRSSGISVMSLAECQLVCSVRRNGPFKDKSCGLVSPMYCLKKWLHCIM